MKKLLSTLTACLLVLCLLASCSGGEQPAVSTEPGATASTETGGGAGPAPSTSGEPASTPDKTPTVPTGDVTPTVPSGEPTSEPPTEPPTTPEPVQGSKGLAYSEYYNGLMVQGLGTCTDTDVIIPSHIDGKSVTAIDGDAFRESAITSVVIPYTVEYIDEDAFIDCKALSSVGFSEGLQRIGDSSFRGCEALKKIELPESLQSIASNAFRYCTGLEEVVIHGCYIIGGNAFEDCTALKKLKIEVKDYSCQIGSNTFAGCTALESAQLGEGVSEIGSWCFSGCTGIKSLILPKSLRTVGACAFQNAKVGQVCYAGTEEQWKSVQIKNSNDALTTAPFKYGSTGPEPVHYSEGLSFTLNDDGASCKVSGFGSCTDEDLLIPPTYEGKPVTMIGYRALERNANLKSVTLPDSVTRIDDSAFQGNPALTTVNWGGGLREIGNSAFYACTALTEAILPEGLETVEPNAFASCKSLGDVTFPASVKSVSSCLLDCGTLGTITVLSAEAVNTFQSWGSTLECDLVIDAPIDTLKEKCFDWCKRIRSITVKSPVTSIADKAFNQCKQAAVIYLPAALRNVGEDVFYGCAALTTVRFGGSEADWNGISFNESSDVLKNATVQFNCEA